MLEYHFSNRHLVSESVGNESSVIKNMFQEPMAFDWECWYSFYSGWQNVDTYEYSNKLISATQGLI